MKRNIKIEIENVFQLSAINSISIIGINLIGGVKRYPTNIADATENYFIIDVSNMPKGVFGFELEFANKKKLHIIRHYKVFEITEKETNIMFNGNNGITYTYE